MRINWEHIRSEWPGGNRTIASPPDNVFRARVRGGWLVFAENGIAESSGLTFIPDPDHEWDGNSN
jgi:hypothetical protein